MKQFLLILFVVSSLSFISSEDKTLKAIEIQAFFQGNSKKALYFKKEDDKKMMEFNIVNMEILEKYDFSDKNFIGKKFKLFYEVQHLESLKDSGNNDGLKLKEIVERKILMNAILLDK